MRDSAPTIWRPAGTAASTNARRGATLTCSPTGEILAADDLATAMFATRPEALVGSRLERWLKAGCLLERVAHDDGQGVTMDVEGRRANGVPFALSVSARRDPDADAHAVLVLRELGIDELMQLAQRFFDVGFDGAPIGMALFNTDGRYVRVNEALCRMLGRSAGELIGRRDQELTHPDDRQRDLDAAWEILEGRRTTFQCEKRFMRPDGSVVWVVANLTFLRDDAGRPLAWIGQFQDITARRSAEEALRVSEERYRLLLGNLPNVGVVLYDRELRCQVIEGGHMEQLTADTDAMIGRHMADILPAAFAKRLEPLARRALGGAAGSVELHSPLSHRMLVVDVAPHHGPDGHISGALFVLRDVTDERAADQARRKAERRFEIAFERAPIGMAMVATSGRFERVNHALCRMTGHAAEDLEALGSFEIVHPDDREAARTAFSSFTRGAETLALEHRWVRADGEAIWVSMDASLIRDADGRPVHALAQVQDIDERRRHELELQHMADHDPLTGLLNRRAFNRALDDHVRAVRDEGPAGAVLVLDLDGFKAVNDTLGHQAGDELIARCARTLRGRLRDSDVIARLGGDEFAVLLPTAGPSDAEIVARDLVDVIRGHRAAAAHDAERQISVSIGVATCSPSSTSEHLLVLADRAMYAAKRAGRDRHAVHRPH